jgi:energy-coupling factor transporter transmembrane protein EcfT
MRSAWHDIWGSARGSAVKLSPRARIIVGASVFATCMIAPATNWKGALAILVTVLTWTALVRPPARVIRSTSLLGLGLLLPYFLLVPLIRDPAAGHAWSQAWTGPWTVFFRGMTAMQASVYTATTLSPSALRQGLSRLPIPEVFSSVLIQIVHQTAGLLYETRQIASAAAVRGGTSGYRAGLYVLTSLPRVWLPRVVDRAERVGAAMELRGYCERDLVDSEVAITAWKDRVAIFLALAIATGAAAFRIWSGEQW